MHELIVSNSQPGSEWIVGGGEMGRLIQALDWSQSPLGPIASWSQSLRTTVNLCLASDLPICIIWGPERVQLYNDGYRVICGEKHPRSMGQNFAECWSEAWPVIGAAHDSAQGGDTAFLEDQQIFLERHGYVEETFFTFSFSPIRDETGRIAGLFHPVIEATAKMLGERRTRTLRDLTSDISNAKTIEEAFALSTTSLAGSPLDLPFLLIYRKTDNGNAALVSAAGQVPGGAGAPKTLSLDSPAGSDWPVAEVMRSGKAVLLDDVAARFGTFNVGPFPEPITAAMILPILKPGADRPVGVIVLGVSPRLKLDEVYAGFHNLVCGAIATAVANADAYDAERKRAEAFARIDRAKTEFFSNVSHEFRTPLTLMLAPLEDALADSTLPPPARALIDVAHRNSLRLLKLVNSLLDFSRIEAGRAQADYEAVDLAEMTAMLASNFRSVCERAGLNLVVDCPSLPDPVYVDRDMWEKIVLNLLSNAFKFTFDGEVAISVRADGAHAVVAVRDTGVGIPAAELPRMFERFHRVENQRGRSFEGSGIGLSLVQELVGLHGGTIGVESEVGAGTVFTVSIPFGTEHLPAGRITRHGATPSTPVRVNAYVEEALRWLPDDMAIAPSTSPLASDLADTLLPLSQVERAHVLLADDNADMRAYIQRLLGGHHDVQAVADGEAALDAARRRRPDLIITDVMMPKLDGIGLVRAIRSDEDLSELPIIMLSARAGEEASAEGLKAGANDYLVKPFSARDLVVRVNASLAMARLRLENAEALRESEARFRNVADNSPMMMWVTDADARCTYLNRAWYEFTGQTREQAEGFGWLEAVHPDDQGWSGETFFTANAKREPFRLEYRLRRADGSYRWAIDAASPRFGPGGEFVGYIGSVIDIHERKAAEELLERLNKTLELEVAQHAADRDRLWQSSQDLLMIARFDGAVVTVNPAWETALGWSEADLVGNPFWTLIHPDDLALYEAQALALTTGGQTSARFECRYRATNGDWHWLAWSVASSAGLFNGVARDITEDKRRTAELEAAHDALRQSQKMEAMGQLTGGVAHDFNNLLTPVMMGLEMLRRAHDDARSQKLIGGALQSAERAKTLIQRLLTFARRQALAPRPVDPATLLNNLSDLIGHSLGPKIDVVMEFDDALPAAMVDPNQLELAILNLSVNARDAMPDGGTLTIAATCRTVAEGDDRDLAAGCYIRFAITDTGCGMDGATLARSIEPFFSTKEPGQGTGLGLAMVHGLAAQSGGVFRLASQPGVGTEASLWIPATDKPATAASPSPEGPEARYSATVLLVDDEELVRGSTAEGLRTLGYTVVEAASAAKALDYLATGLRPDLVVTDHMMPGMTGAQLAVQLRGIAPSLPVLMITGYASMTPGQTDGLAVLAKPFGQTELAARVESLLQS